MRSRVGAWCLVGALTLLVGCERRDLLGLNAPQGVEGVVLLGPQCPVQAEQDPCADEPYQAWIEIWNAIGQLVTRFQSGEDGRFRVGLSPGPYVLRPDNGDPFPVASEQEVIVREGVYTEVVVNYDTGIR